MTEDDARREVRREVDRRGGRVAFARAAKISPDTLGDFLDGRRWPQGPTRAKIEDELGWPAGRIEDMRDGIGLQPATGTLEDAIRTDPRLLPEARAHLLNQVELLLRLQAAGAAPSAFLDEQERRRVEAAEAAAAAAAADASLAETEAVEEGPAAPVSLSSQRSGRKGRPRGT